MKLKEAVFSIAIVLIAIAFTLRFNNNQEKIEELKKQLAAAQQHVPLIRDTVILHKTDTVQVVTAPVITAELKELRKQHLIDEQTIKELGLKLKQMDAVQNTTIETKDTVKGSFINDLRVFSFQDKWSDLRFSLQDSTFYYNIRDSLATIVYHEYKHRFLWWRWGVKGYKVKVVNFNPHSTIIYNSYVMPEK